MIINEWPIFPGSLLALLQNIFAFIKTFKTFSDMAKLCRNLQRSISVHEHNSNQIMFNH